MGCGGSKDSVQTPPDQARKDQARTNQAQKNRAQGDQAQKNRAQGDHAHENEANKNQDRKNPEGGRSRPTKTTAAAPAQDSRKAVDKGTKERDLDESFGDASYKKLSKEDQLRQELLLATESGDKGRLDRAIRDYQHHQLPNTPELIRARRALTTLHEEELQSAMDSQDLEALEAAIDAAYESVVLPELHEGQVLKEAESLRSLLRRLKLYVHKVLELRPMTVSEIHSYKRPRPLVHAVMKATYLLLGEQERSLQQWEYIQSLLRRQGRGSIIRRIKAYDVNGMKRAKVDRAQGHLRLCSKDTVRQTSAGAGTFYLWSSNIIKERASGGEEKS